MQTEQNHFSQFVKQFSRVHKYQMNFFYSRSCDICIFASFFQVWSDAQLCLFDILFLKKIFIFGKHHIYA